MKYFFDFPFPLPPGQSVDDVLLDRVASSGTVASVRLALALARLGNDCTIVQTGGEPRASRVVEGVTVTSVAGSNELGSLLTGDDRAVLVLPPRSAMPALRSLPRNRTAAVVFWLHNNLAIDLLDEAFARGLDRVVCVSRPAAGVYDGYPWWWRIDAVPYSLRGYTPEMTLEPERTRIAFIGATTEAKGFQHVLSAWPLVLESEPGATLDVFGSVTLHQPEAQTGEIRALTPDFERNHWRPFVERAGEKGAASVRFHGSIGRAEMFEQLRRVRAVIVNPNLTGSTETFCLSAVEAQACGLPVIGAAAQGLLETIADGRSGLLLRSQSPAELSAAVLRLVGDDRLWARLSAGARQHAAQYRDPNVEAERWMEVAAWTFAGRRTERTRSMAGVVKGMSGLGRAKLALKRRLRPHPDLHPRT